MQEDPRSYLEQDPGVVPGLDPLLPVAPTDAGVAVEASAVPVRWYRYQPFQLGFGELWQATGRPRWLLFPLTLAMMGVVRLFSGRFPLWSGVAAVDSVVPFEVTETDFPEDTRAELARVAEQLAPLGFHSPVYYSIRDEVNLATYEFGNWAQVEGQAVAQVVVQTSGGARTRTVLCSFFSRTPSGHWLVSSQGPPASRTPPGEAARSFPGSTPEQLLEAHRARLLELPSSEAVRIVLWPDEVRTWTEELHRERFKFRLQLGVFRPLTAEELRQHFGLEEALRQAHAAGFPFPAVLGELWRLQNATSSWTSSLVTLAVSLLLFLGTNGLGLQGSPSMLAMLVGVLFVHELGHLTAMRIFGYQNLRMFFIPFLGAAATGRRFNVSAWKQIIVSLAGPVPGIVMGALLTVLGVVLRSSLVMQAAGLCLALNAFNLLPLLPLDGGNVARHLLFARIPWLDASFRVLAGVLIIVLSWLVGAWLLGLVGVALLLGARAAYAQGRIAVELREAGISPRSEDDQTIPLDVAATIIWRVQAGISRSHQPRVTALHTLQVFELLNSRRCGIWASLGLGTVWAGSFLVALVFGAVLLVAQPLTERRPRAARGLGASTMAPFGASAVPSGSGGVRPQPR